MASEGCDILVVPGLEPDTKYNLATRPQSIFIRRFGGLVKFLLPIELNPAGIVLNTANKFYKITDCVEAYDVYGKTLGAGILLNNQFMGSYYNEQTRLLGDYGSNLYVISKL
jgi:alpha-galactosidase